MSALARYADLDSLVCDELNVRRLDRIVATTTGGPLTLRFEQGEYRLLLDGADVTTPRLLENLAARVLAEFYGGVR